LYPDRKFLALHATMITRVCNALNTASAGSRKPDGFRLARIEDGVLTWPGEGKWVLDWSGRFAEHKRDRPWLRDAFIPCKPVGQQTLYRVYHGVIVKKL